MGPYYINITGLLKLNLNESLKSFIIPSQLSPLTPSAANTSCSHSPGNRITACCVRAFVCGTQLGLVCLDYECLFFHYIIQI